ncbi:MAG: DUF1330 domain-containing protein [Hyphomicrobiaceae bacterium]
MTAYAIVGENIHDQAMFDDYRRDVLPTLAPFKGEFVVRGGAFTVLEGEFPYQRLVVIAFPSRAQAEGWYHSEAYQKLLPLRLKSTTGVFVIVDGI